MAKNDHFWRFLTIFGFKMRFFIFERFVNPARDAFPVWFHNQVLYQAKSIRPYRDLGSADVDLT